VSKRYPPEDPREWLNRARSNLALAKAKRKGVYLEALCFDAQQAAEKAIKALLIVWCFRNSQHLSTVIPGELAIASATRNPGGVSGSGFPLPRE